MKIFLLAFIFVSLNIKAEDQCPIEADVNEMYSLFFSVAYKPCLLYTSPSPRD